MALFPHRNVEKFHKEDEKLLAIAFGMFRATFCTIQISQPTIREPKQVNITDNIHRTCDQRESTFLIHLDYVAVLI